MSQGESVVSNASIMQRAEALEKAEKEAADKGGSEAEAKAKADKEVADKAAADKAAAEKAEADKKAAEEAGKGKSEPKAEDKGKKAPNDPDELRKWNTRNAQENKKLRDEIASLKETQEKTLKVLSNLSKTPVDLKELAKDPEKLQKFIDDERDSATAELQEQLQQLANEAKSKDTFIERMKREQDTENYPRWKELYPQIVKIAMGPTGQGDPRVDFTKGAGEVLDRLYEIALEENPKAAEPPKPAVKTYTEDEVKAMVADMVSKEKEAIAKTAKEEAAKEAQRALAEETRGGTVASAGKGASRVPSDALAAFKKMSMAEQREWLIQQSQAGNQ